MASLVIYRSVNPMLVFQRAIVLRKSDRLLHILSATASTAMALKGCGHRNRAWKSDRLKRSCCTDAFIVANDKKYGHKQVISITPQLYEYILTNVREPKILRELREETATMRGSQMLVSPDQAQLLAMLVQILGAERCIELGVYTGYSSLAIALVLPESGCLVACERDAKSLEVAKKYYDRAGVSHKVDLRHGLAAEVLKSLILNGETCSPHAKVKVHIRQLTFGVHKDGIYMACHYIYLVFVCLMFSRQTKCYDFAFVDAEKKMNQEYYELLLQLVRVGGVIVIDNVLWHGKAADPLVNDARTVSIRNFNKYIMEDNRVSISMVPIGDGMTICRKK